MSLATLLAVSALGCPWSRPSTSYYSECVTVYLPCAPVYRVASVGNPCCMEVVATAPAPAPQALAEVKAEEPVTEPVGLQFPSSMLLDQLALDWGVSNIGAGSLQPTASLQSSGIGGFPFSYPQNGTAPGVISNLTPGGVVVNIPPTTINTPPPQVVVPPCCNQPKPPPNVVPEPTSIACWSALAGVGFLKLRRKKKSAAG